MIAFGYSSSNSCPFLTELGLFNMHACVDEQDCAGLMRLEWKSLEANCGSEKFGSDVSAVKKLGGGGRWGLSPWIFLMDFWGDVLR